MRSFSPMKSDVEDTFGFSRSSVDTGTPLFDEITPNVSPACTVQNRFAGRRPAVFVVVVEAVETRSGCVVAVRDRDGEPPFSSPE